MIHIVPHAPDGGRLGGEQGLRSRVLIAHPAETHLLGARRRAFDPVILGVVGELALLAELGRRLQLGLGPILVHLDPAGDPHLETRISRCSYLLLRLVGRLLSTAALVLDASMLKR